MSVTPTIRMDRSPSHESVTTDLSLLSLSSLNSDRTKWPPSPSSHTTAMVKPKLTTDGADLTSPTPLGLTSMRRSPTPMERCHMASSRNSLLQIPGESRGRSSVSPKFGKPFNQIIFEEESDLIKNCGKLLSALGLSKSFSTGDICGLLQKDDEVPIRQAVSDAALNDWNPKFDIPQLGFSATRPLDCASRSCSTWVAVGDAMSSTSQLPSPQAQPGSLGENVVEFSAADFVRSVNKKVRQNYIRGRVMSTYRVLQRLNQTQNQSPTTSLTNVNPMVTTTTSTMTNAYPTVTVTSQETSNKEEDEQLTKILNSSGFMKHSRSKVVSLKDVEKDKGKPLTKYDRNMMIFTWLHNLQESSFEHLSS